MADEDTIKVQSASNRGVVEVQVEGRSYILGIYDESDDPVSDVLLNEFEVEELITKLRSSLTSKRRTKRASHKKK
jgi:hypothetical protein